MKRKTWNLALALILTLALTGCIKMEIGVQVNMDESGTLSIIVGLSDEFMMFAEQSMEDLQDELLADMDDEDREKFEVVTWTEDGYEYLEASAAFEDLDELHEMVQGTDFFDSFSLTTNSTFFSKEFYLDAQLHPMTEIFGEGMEDEDLGDFNFNTDEMIDFTIVVDLPGAVQDTNGFEREEGGIIWNLNGGSDSRLYAESSGLKLDFSDPIPWLIGGGILLVCCGGIILAILIPVTLTLRSKKQKQAAQTEESPPA